jgi:hypothetical protein
MPSSPIPPRRPEVRLPVRGPPAWTGRPRAVRSPPADLIIVLDIGDLGRLHAERHGRGRGAGGVHRPPRELGRPAPGPRYPTRAPRPPGSSSSSSPWPMGGRSRVGRPGLYAPSSPIPALPLQQHPAAHLAGRRGAARGRVDPEEIYLESTPGPEGRPRSLPRALQTLVVEPEHNSRGSRCARRDRAAGRLLGRSGRGRGISRSIEGCGWRCCSGK